MISDDIYGFYQVPFQIKKRLVKIEIKKNSALWRSYNFEYRRPDIRSHLANITIKNPDGEQKLPIEFL